MPSLSHFTILLLACLPGAVGQARSTLATESGGHETQLFMTEPAWWASTPVHTAQIELPRFNEMLKAAIGVVRNQADPIGRQVSNRGGWQSHSNLFEYVDRLKGAAGVLGDALELLVDLVHTMALEVLSRQHLKEQANPDHQYEARILAAWANANEAGHTNMPHTHPNSLFSGVYYIDTGMGDSAEACEGSCYGSRLVFHDPRPSAAGHPMTEPYHSVAPVSGLLVLFPSWLRHHVEPHAGNRTRLSVSFNVHVTRVSTSKHVARRAHGDSIPRMPYDTIETAALDTIWRQILTQNILARLSDSVKPTTLATLRHRFHSHELWASRYSYAACHEGTCLQAVGRLMPLLVERLRDAPGMVAHDFWEWPEVRASGLREHVLCGASLFADTVKIGQLRQQAEHAGWWQAALDTTHAYGSKRFRDARPLQDNFTCAALAAHWPTRRLSGRAFLEPVSTARGVLTQLNMHRIALGSRADVSGIMYGSNGFEQGLVLSDPRGAAAVLDIGLRGLTGSSVQTAGSAAGLMVLMPSFVDAELAPPSNATYALAADATDPASLCLADECPAPEFGADSWVWVGGVPHRLGLVFDVTMDL